MSGGTPLHGEQPGDVRGDEQVLIALLLGPVERARITTALRNSPIVPRFLDRIVDLMEAVRQERRPIAAIMVEVRDSDGRPVHEVVRALRAGGAGVPLVGYCRAGTEDSNDFRSLVLAGAHRLVFHGIDDTGFALRSILNDAQQASAGERAAAELMRVVPAKLAPIVSYVTRYPATKQVSQLAEALGYHRKTLVNHCAQAGFLPPHELLCWCRLTVAGELMASSYDTIEKIANKLLFSSDTGFRNMMKRYTGLRASEVRERGGARCVVAALRRSLRGHETSRSRVG